MVKPKVLVDGVNCDFYTDEIVCCQCHQWVGDEDCGCTDGSEIDWAYEQERDKRNGL